MYQDTEELGIWDGMKGSKDTVFIFGRDGKLIKQLDPPASNMGNEEPSCDDIPEVITTLLDALKEEEVVNENGIVTAGRTFECPPKRLNLTTPILEETLPTNNKTSSSMNNKTLPLTKDEKRMKEKKERKVEMVEKFKVMKEEEIEKKEKIKKEHEKKLKEIKGKISKKHEDEEGKDVDENSKIQKKRKTKRGKKEKRNKKNERETD